MKFQPRRFVVEVKRGTSRATFTSPDTVSDKFNSAEELLFGGPQRKVSRGAGSPEQASTPAGGRVLKSLIEPPAPVVEDLPERPRRGRKPGSKNKPKLPQIVPAAVSSEPFLVRNGGAPAYRGFSEDGPSWRESVVEAEVPSSPSPAPQAEPAPASPLSETGRHTRLRDRSTIIKRYVLDSEPRAGQAGWLRSRKAARAAR